MHVTITEKVAHMGAMSVKAQIAVLLFYKNFSLMTLSGPQTFTSAINVCLHVYVDTQCASPFLYMLVLLLLLLKNHTA